MHRFLSTIFAYLVQFGGLKYGVLATFLLLVSAVSIDQTPWLLFDHVEFYQYILIMIANHLIHFLSWTLSSPFPWRQAIAEYFHFTITMWITWLLLSGSFSIGYEASKVADNWILSIGTVVYLAIFYPFAKSALLWVLQRQGFWVTLHKKLKEAGADEIVMLGYQINLYYLYDLLLSLAGKVLILRSRNLLTFYLSLLGSTAFRISGRFLGSVLLLRRIIGNQKDAKSSVPKLQDHLKTKASSKVSPSPNVVEVDMSLPMYIDNNTPGHIDASKSLTKKTLETKTQQAGRNSLQHRIAQNIDSKLYNRELSGPESTTRSITFRIITFIDKSKIIPELETATTESIGIRGMTIMTSDLFSKLTASAI
ncbi:hypothetical protein HDU76_013684, partial [Blyttiomyces sp. JEL0837]